MYLKSLELQGFKSFPDKTVLSFGEDITAIVGPNGSGKSNISDAICWVLGEQSARSLRGAKMEDVIFGGTEKRGSVGFAQVTLVLDNSAGTFPTVDASEVMVTRRYYRSGESEYYINKQSVRLRELNELFMDTGLGREGYSVIGQGRIDEILSVKSGDRREIFEEAAGISKYRHRKEETERKLQRTEENLVRINDKLAELELQVEPLRAQAETAKRYLILRDELRVLEISVWLEKLQELRTAAIQLQADRAAAQGQKDSLSQQLEALYRASDSFSQQVQANDLEQEQVRSAADGMEAQASEQDSTIAALRSGVRHDQESIQLLEREMEDQSQRSGSIQEQLQQQRERIDAVDRHMAALRAELDQLLEQAREASERVGGAETEMQALQAKEALAVAAAADRRAELSALAASGEQMEQRVGAVDSELAAARARRETALGEKRQTRQALEDAREEAASVVNIIQGHQLRLAGRVQREERAAKVCMELTMEQNNLDSRICLLTEMEKEYEGFNKAVRVVMQAAEGGALRGVHGPVANLIRTDGAYAVALEIALGAGLQNIVVEREEDAKAAISFLKRRDSGRATFLPLTAIRGDELRERGLEQEPGYLGIASRLVSHDPKYDNICKNLLGRTVVVEDMDCGIAIARRYQNRFRIVTLDGQVINRGGSMTGGSVSRSAGILSRANELEQLRTQRQQLAGKLGEAQRERETAARELAAARYEMENAEGQRRAAEDTVLKLQGQLDHFGALLEGLEQSVEALAREKEELSERLLAVNSQREAVRQALERHEQESRALRTQMQEKLSGQWSLREQDRRLGEAVAQHKEELAALAAERETTARALGDMEQVARDMEQDRAGRLRRLAEYRAAIEKTEGEIQLCTQQAAALRLRAVEHRRQLNTLRDAKLRLEQERGELGQRLKTCNDELLNAEREVSRLEQRISAGTMEENQLLDKLWESYELSHSAAMEQRIELESVAKANRRIGELRREIGGLGSVNVGAIEEFDRVNTRYTYLTDQRDDVEKAKGDLAGIIDELTREMTAIFAQQFQLISQAFQETFVDLFGGGQATLELEDPSDILGCGIEIRVQPPGKTLKTITLLSGGEKAFVAIALYFAILKVHPTPFCVMDEIEAALDDANVVRFARYMRSMADRTQFIVITHRRGTMEEADILYGVTMQEKGVSKLLSIRLNELVEQLRIQ